MEQIVSSAEIERRIKRLSPKAREVFDLIAVNCDSFVHPSTGKSLVSKGLVVMREEKIRNGLMNITVFRYDVPLHVHMVWAKVCADEVKE